MPLHFAERTAVLSGTVVVEEAEPLATWLRATPAAAVDLGDCTHLHTAALQALLAAGVKVDVPPADPFLRAWIAPLLAPAPVEELVADPAALTSPAENPAPEEVPA